MLDPSGCAEAVVDFDVDKHEVLILGPERVLQITPGVYFDGATPNSGFDQQGDGANSGKCHG